MPHFPHLKTSRLLRWRSGLFDLGSGTKPFCKLQRSSTCAGVTPSRSATCLTTGSPSFCALASGE
jgi:hypothetical protein